MMQQYRNVFDLLDHIRERTGMYLRDSSLKELETLLWGYYTALRTHGIVEDVPEMGLHFHNWLWNREGFPSAIGWGTVLDDKYSDRDTAIAKLFEYVDEYRKLNPVVLYTVRLTARHEPTGNRVQTGLGGLMEKPRRVDIVRYRPEPIHFLRFHYHGRAVNGDLLMTRSGEYATTARIAKEWVRDELRVEFTEWEKVSGPEQASRRR
jgi:hypothetical protein